MPVPDIAHAHSSIRYARTGFMALNAGVRCAPWYHRSPSQYSQTRRLIPHSSMLIRVGTYPFSVGSYA
eukprot:1133514-Rhodomonas_salina.1